MAELRPWIKPGALVRLHPYDGTESRIVRVYDIRGDLVLIGAEKGKTGTALVDETLIDVPVKPQKREQ